MKSKDIAKWWSLAAVLMFAAAVFQIVSERFLLGAVCFEKDLFGNLDQWLTGQAADTEDMQRFSGISTLLFSKQEVSNFLLAEMRLQQMMADIFKIVTEAADVDISIPGLEG